MKDAMLDVTTSQYDARNRLELVTDPDPDGANQPLIAPQSKYTYDDADNTLTSGVRISIQNNVPVFLTTIYTYDFLNRQKTETDAENRVSTREYNDAGLLFRVTDGGGVHTDYQYNKADWMTRETIEVGPFREWKYNLNGTVRQEIARDGRVTEFQYDNMDRPVEERWMNGATVTRRIATLYDAGGRVRSVTDKGQSSNVLSTVRYAWDNLDRQLIEENTRTAGVPSVVMTSAWDAVGNRTSLQTDVAGIADFVNLFELDGLDRVTRIGQVKGSPGSTSVVTQKRVDLKYNAVGQTVRTDQYENSLTTSRFVAASIFGYDDAGRMTSLQHRRGSVILSNYVWGFDAANRMTTIANTPTTAVADNALSMSYDNTGQLKTAAIAGQSAESYNYDAGGNRTGAGYVTATNTNRVQNDGTFSYTYDNEGRRTRRTTTANGDYTVFDWDYRGRLITVTDYTGVTAQVPAGVKSKQVSYAYDSRDRRISKDVDANGDGTIDRGERYGYDGDDLSFIFTDADGSGPAVAALNTRLLQGPDVDQLFADETALGEVLWTLSDHQGTVRDVADFTVAANSTAVINHIRYDSFGKIIAETNPATGNAATAGGIQAGDIVQGFTGREYDPDTGLSWYRARWYDPSIGRFLSEDPSGFDGGDLNLTRYVGNSPWNYTDPSGMTRTSPLSSVQTPQASYKGDDPSWRWPWDPKASWNVGTTANLWLGGSYVAATETMRFGQGYGDKFVTQGSTAGSTLWNSGGAMGNSIGTHASTLWYDPAEEWSSVKNSATSTYNGLYNLGASIYNNPGATASSAFNSSVDYLDRFTSDPKVSGEFLGNGAQETAIFAVTAGAGNAIRGTQTFQTVVTKFDNVVDAVKSTRLEVYRIPYDPTKLNSSINPTGMGIRRTAQRDMDYEDALLDPHDVQFYKESGNYELEFQTGMKYHGKGLEPRMNDSASRVARERADSVVRRTYTPANNEVDALIEEDRRIAADGGVKGGQLYNKINSPGKKLGGQ